MFGKPPCEDDKLDDVEHVIGLAGSGVEAEKKFIERIQHSASAGRASDLQHFWLKFEAAFEDAEDEETGVLQVFFARKVDILVQQVRAFVQDEQQLSKHLRHLKKNHYFFVSKRYLKI